MRFNKTTPKIYNINNSNNNNYNRANKLSIKITLKILLNKLIIRIKKICKVKETVFIQL